VLKLALSERGWIELYHLFDAAEQRCEHLRRELTEKGEHEAATDQAKRRDDYAGIRQRILEALRTGRPPSRLERLSWFLRSMWPAPPLHDDARRQQRYRGN
jgi:hypothetical protein